MAAAARAEARDRVEPRLRETPETVCSTQPPAKPTTTQQVVAVPEVPTAFENLEKRIDLIAADQTQVGMARKRPYPWPHWAPEMWPLYRL
ncbi:MAG: hypothetical protein GDA40_05100 [Rhodobacteraceae bacterium]|nr:hypothetical protein [Paracoccaceae bacterium]